ncbi:glycine-rich protein DOT1-like isoform X1 [Triticum dicoccoides]|uniref:glycine-rich protein DOT1-like isoform X1 n=1 Tax=Triticum dicoccoides TaxID=85692 RepID=UPI001890DE72|nr:glycine-rich protein DOT1-like isoform X1 [Triticum dicoccoides]XP_044390109.1 glycine-rich protein DOT1-like isoform X1 [Triticum aestivum]
MEEGVADAAPGEGMDGAVEEGHGAAPASSSGDHGGQEKGGHGGMKEDGPGAAPEGDHGGEVEGGQGAAPEGGQGAAPKQGNDDGATATDASTPAWLEGSIADWDTIHGFVRLHFLYIERVCFPVAKLFISEGWSPPAICIR